MIYDIRTSEKALKTLVELTGVSKDIWDNYMDRMIVAKLRSHIAVNYFNCAEEILACLG